MCYQKEKGIAKRRAHVHRLNRKAEKVLRRMFSDTPAECDAHKFAPYWRDNLAKCSCDMCTGHDKDHRYKPEASEQLADAGISELEDQFVVWRAFDNNGN